MKRDRENLELLLYETEHNKDSKVGYFLIMTALFVHSPKP